MTKEKWLQIGYDSNVIDLETVEEITFRHAFSEWFLMKMKVCKPDSVDRIEVTFNRYYDTDEFVEKYISTISENDIIDFLTACMIKNPDMTYKEFCRILQIVNNTLVYFKDLRRGGVGLYDWDKIKRYLPISKLEKRQKHEFAVKESDVSKLIEHVLVYDVYPDKRDACLCLCMNFYLGLRIGELAALSFDAFDFERNVVRVFRTMSKSYTRLEDGSVSGSMVYRVVDDCKTVHSVREIPLVPEVKVFYEKIRANHIAKKYDSSYLAYDGSDTNLYKSLDRTLRRLCNLCDVPYFNSHVIRKTFATKLHFANVPTRVISDLMGHSEIATTENSYILTYNNNYRQLLDYMEGGLTYAICDQCNGTA